MALRARWATGASDGRQKSLQGVRVVVSAEGWTSFAGDWLPDDVASAVRDLLDRQQPDIAAAWPSAVASCAELLSSSVGPVRVEGGPVFVFPTSVNAEVTADVRVVTSMDDDRERLVPFRPSNWEAEEWSELLRGDLGPWAIAVMDGQVVSVCHTPRPLIATAAECGVWTHPSQRGQRLAEITTAAWARVVARTGRVLFYSTDESNLASQRVASRLGLRLLGRQWTLTAGPWPEGDAWGNALLDYQRGVWVPMPELETDLGHVGDAMHPEWFFRDYDRWDWWERELLPLAAQGPALDLGAGAGRAALWLQNRGIDVTAVDSSPGAVRVCRERGLLDVREADLNTPPDDRRWRAIFLLCGNLGLGGSWEANRALLARLAVVAAPGAILVGDTVEPAGPPEIGLRIRYKGTATRWWRQRNVAVAEIPSLIDGTGWSLDRQLVDQPDHAVLLRRR
jgi:RimJ/RimL family protein N-acetyltransferase